MATYTTNLGLIKPAYTDDADISDINDNMDTIDTAFGNISQSTLRDVPLAVAVSDWTAVTGGFSAEFTTAYVTASSKEEVFYDSSLKDYCQAHIIANKKSGGGGIILTTAVKPTGTITGTVRIFDNGDGKVPILIEDTVTPIANGGTGQSSLAGAQQVLGITALNTQIANKTPKYSYEYTNDAVSIPNASFETVKSLNITPGIWLVIGTINFNENTTGIRICMVTGDSTDVLNGMENSSLASGRATLSYTRVFRTSSNMTVYLRGYQNSGYAMNVKGQIVAVRLDTQYT